MTMGQATYPVTPDQCPAQLLAFVALDTDTAWLFTLKEAQELAQQHSERGILTVRMHCVRRVITPTAQTRCSVSGGSDRTG